MNLWCFRVVELKDCYWWRYLEFNLLITFMWSGLRKCEIFTSVTAPQYIHNAKRSTNWYSSGLCIYLTPLVGLFSTLFNQTFDHLMASLSTEFSAAQRKSLCCDAESKGLRFDSSWRLGFFPRDNTNTSFFNLSICFYYLICRMMVRD